MKGPLPPTIVKPLEGVATALVLALPIGIGLFVCGCLLERWFGVGPGAVQTLAMRLAVRLTVSGYLLLPAGVLLHWVVATVTGVYHRWVWLSIFWGSVILMYVHYPNGTISGGVTLCVPFVSKTFKKMGNGVRVFR